MDAYGHVNNVQFFRLLEEARVSAFIRPGTDGGPSLLDSGLVVAGARIDYLLPLVYRPAPVAVDLWVTAVAGASFDLGYEVLDGAQGQPGDPAVYARAETRMVAYDLAGDRPRRLTGDERERLAAWRDGPVRWRSRP